MRMFGCFEGMWRVQDTLDFEVDRSCNTLNVVKRNSLFGSLIPSHFCFHTLGLEPRAMHGTKTGEHVVWEAVMDRKTTRKKHMVRSSPDFDRICIITIAKRKR